MPAHDNHTLKCSNLKSAFVKSKFTPNFDVHTITKFAKLKKFSNDAPLGKFGNKNESNFKSKKWG